VPTGYSMSRYQAFARQAALPNMTVAAGNLEVGDKLTIPINPPAELTAEQQAALTNLLQVPVGVITNCFASLTNQPAGEPQAFAQKLRAAATDYKFLSSEWTKYQPQGEAQKVKAQALQLLEAGDIAQAWDLYDALPRPAPPMGLRVIAQ
jgi:hypothetical protein